MSFNGVVPAESCLSKIPPLQNPVFIADLHLAADKPATKEAFFKFLKNDAARFSELVILGDLFEFWAGDDHAPAYADILEALKAFFLNGHRIYVMHGNRDFLLGKGFTAATGAQLIADPIPVQVGFDHILLSHGDMWCTLDPEYQQFRATLRRPDVHKLFGMVLQDTWLFEGTIRENLVYNMEGITDEQLEAVCKACGLDKFVHSLPQGFDTVLSESTTISAGQKQLLTIARAMLQNAPMLILDEATSSVDTRTELLIQRAMDELTKGRTSFVIAHRLSTIKNADLILVMRDGDVIESGTHEQLMEQGGFYAELYNSQFAQAS